MLTVYRWDLDQLVSLDKLRWLEHVEHKITLIGWIKQAHAEERGRIEDMKRLSVLFQENAEVQLKSNQIYFVTQKYK